MFPAYASLPGGPNSTSSNTTVVSNGIPPEYRLQPDPDWPEFDRFAQPSADLWSTNTQLTNPAPTSVPDLLLSDFDGTNNATTSLTRLQMPKPDRYIERAFYFIGPPEQNADGGSTNRLQALWKNSRDLSQPGLLLPDLSYEMWISRCARTPSG